MKIETKGGDTVGVNIPTYDVAPFIDGETVPSASDETLPVFNPANGKKNREIPAGCDADINCAVTAARTAFDDGRWSDLPPSQRRGILHKFADLIEVEASSLDILDCLDMGKPVSSPMANANSAAYMIRHSADSIDKILGDVYTSDATSLVIQRRVPQGVVAAIVPWNFPVVNAAMKIAPALAVGNCVVLKPSENSSQSALRLAQLAIYAGIPAGVLNVVPGKGDIVGRALAQHRQVDMLTFTGSTAVGKLMLQYAGQSNMKLVNAECGGKSPHIVFADFEDLDTAASAIAQSILTNQGQLCVAGSRLLVQKDIETRLIEKVSARFKDIVAGDPLDPVTTFGPLVNKQQMERVLSYIAAGKASGAELILGGKRILEASGGFFVEPTLFSNVSPEAIIAQEEIFGPVLSVTSFENVEDAIRLANSTAYGLAAHVWTTHLPTGIKFAKSLCSPVIVYGSAPVGEGAGLALATEPYGESGVGVEGGLAGMETYTRRQPIWFNHG